MLKTASFSNFTSVPNQTWKFSSSLNIVVGENGLGKSHVLKSIYAVLKSLTPDPLSVEGLQGERIVKSQLEKRIAEELLGNMRPDSLGRLVKRQQGRGRAEVTLTFRKKAHDTGFSFATNSKTQVDVMTMPSALLETSPVYIPTRELITLSPWFVSLYDSYNVPFEKSWRDTVMLLGAPSLRGPKEAGVRDTITVIEEAMGGKVEVDANGRFFLRVSGGRMEANLVAEGLRKFAMLARLISTGALLNGSYLLWDEPETNLNPKLIKVLARVIVDLSKSGVQVFLATHSIFMLREIEIIAREESKSDEKYFAISDGGDKGVSQLEQSKHLEDLDTLVLLDEELQQTERFMDAQDDDG